MKKCGKCKKFKSLDEFSKNIRYKDKKHDTCKKCRKDYNLANPVKIQKYLEKNKDIIKTKRNAYYKKNKKEILKYNAEYYKNPLNKLSKKEYAKNYYNDPKNKSNKKKYVKKWFENNPEYLKKYMNKRYKTDINFKIKSNLRSRFFNSINNKFKKVSIIKLIGCSISKFRNHIESQFKPEMNWSNHGKIWEVDHIKGCCGFDLTKLEEQQKCFHYTNLQPLFKTTQIAESFGYFNEIGNRDKPKSIN